MTINPIMASVGVQGANRPGDVKTVQSLLNFVPTLHGGPGQGLKIDGLVGPKTIKAIRDFQMKSFGFSGADGRVDPGRQTFQKLSTFVPAQTTAHTFSGFSNEQVTTLLHEFEHAKDMLDHARDMLALAPFLRADTMPVQTLLHNFDIDIKSEGNPIAQAFAQTQLLMLQSNIARLRLAMNTGVPLVLEPPAEFGPDAFVIGTSDPTVHVRARYFDRCSRVRAATLIHERAHTILTATGHAGMGGGLAVLVVTPDEDKRPFFTNRQRFFEDAMMNPFNYEWVCMSLESGYQRSQHEFGGECGGS